MVEEVKNEVDISQNENFGTKSFRVSFFARLYFEKYR